MTKPSDTLARLRARSQEAGRFVLALDPQWAEKISNAYRKVRQLESETLGLDVALADQLATAREDLAQLESLAGENTIVFRFRRMAKPEYEQLLAAHPINAEQRKAQDDAQVPPYLRKVWNEETFEPALVHKVLVEPEMSFEDVRSMLRSVENPPPMSMGEAKQLVDAAMSAALSAPSRVPEELKLP